VDFSSVLIQGRFRARLEFKAGSWGGHGKDNRTHKIATVSWLPRP